MATEVQRTRRLFSADEYARMVAAGILGRGDRVELIEGEIVEMSPIGHRHMAVVANLLRILVTRVGDRAVVSPPASLKLSTRSMPEPDVTLLRPRSYFEAHATVADVLLVVEVSESSLAWDRSVKLALYARAGILEYWIVDVEGTAVETFRTPTVTGYRDARRFSRADVVEASGLVDVAFRVSELFV
jgi:Uma2 family endonuclease